MFNFNFSESDLKQTKFYQQVFSEGEAVGEANMLRCLLEHRFGPLSDSAKRRLATADAATLLLWADRLLDARSLDDVWGH
ncbi:hypothetical protein [Methylomagnum sp.]